LTKAIQPHKYGYTDFHISRIDPMKTTVELSDDLYRRAKATAALRGQKLRDLVEEGLRRVVDSPAQAAAAPSLAELMKAAIGAVDSGVGDLSSNPAHLEEFGREPQHRHR
jgi:hypothetical protein